MQEEDYSELSDGGEAAISGKRNTVLWIRSRFLLTETAAEYMIKYNKLYLILQGGECYAGGKLHRAAQ